MPQETTAPTFEFETRLWQQGFFHVAGIDEVGRGALAGPVVAGAAVVPYNAELKGIWAKVRDSKLLTPTQRTEYAAEIRLEAAAWGIGAVSPQTIDQVNIAVATRQAMQRAVQALVPAPDYLLIDWVRLHMLNIAQESHTKADMRIVSVAAASILAKVHRDELMIDLGQRFPAYQFASNKGYGTAAHRTAIVEHGPCPEHRHSFAPIAEKKVAQKKGLFDKKIGNSSPAE